MLSNHRARSVAVWVPILAMLLLLPSTLEAQVAKRVVFAKGKSSAILRGKLPIKHADYDAYIIRGRMGQTLSVKLTTDEPNAYIKIFESRQLGPDEDLMSVDEEYPRQWSGKLPLTSMYSVQVYGVRAPDQNSARAAYSIEISVR